MLASYSREYMRAADQEPKRHLKERKLESFASELELTEEWLGDVFYRGYIGASGEPKGIIPQD